MTYLVKEEFATHFRRFLQGMDIEVDDIDSPMTPEQLTKIGKIERKPESRAAERARVAVPERVVARPARDKSDEKEDE